MKKLLLFFILCFYLFAANAQQKMIGKIIKEHSYLDSIICPSSKVVKLVGGFYFTEGPVWSDNGYLLFTDIPSNRIIKWEEGKGITVVRDKAGIMYYEEIQMKGGKGGANGLAFDKEGNLLVCEHGNRIVSKTLKSGKIEIVAGNYYGKKFNSPNDLVVKSDGSIYFTDPPYGLPKEDKSPLKELKVNGVYRVKDGKIDLLCGGLKRPNGLAFSPDEKNLIVANSGPNRMWYKFDLKDDGKLTKRKVFYCACHSEKPGAPDGMKVDIKGNFYCTGPGGVIIFGPCGKLLGTIQFPELPSNCAFGGPDMKTLYVTARTGLYSIRVKIPGKK